MIDLAEELAEVRSPLVPHPRLGDERRLIARLDDAVREVDVFAEAHLREAAQLLIHLAAYAHVVGAREELVELRLAAADAARREERRHRVGDGLLHRCERLMGPVWAAPCVDITRNTIVYRLKVSFGQHHVGVEHDEPVAVGALCAVVAALSRSAVVLIIIMYVECAGIFFAHLLAGFLRPVFHDNHLEVAQRLACQALQQFVHLVGTVEYGYDNGILHGLSFRYVLSSAKVIIFSITANFFDAQKKTPLP